MKLRSPSTGRFVPSAVEVRFWEKVRKTNDCWLWTAALDKDGYGHLRDEWKRRTCAHRLSFRLHYGREPDGLVLHRCNTPSCVRPDHLYEGTHDENMRDRREAGNYARPISLFCRRGHHIDGDNLYVEPDGRRRCRKCQLLRKRAYNARQRERSAAHGRER